MEEEVGLVECQGQGLDTPCKLASGDIERKQSRNERGKQERGRK